MDVVVFYNVPSTRNYKQLYSVCTYIRGSRLSQIKNCGSCIQNYILYFHFIFTLFSLYVLFTNLNPGQMAGNIKTIKVNQSQNFQLQQPPFASSLSMCKLDINRLCLHSTILYIFTIKKQKKQTALYCNYKEQVNTNVYVIGKTCLYRN